MGLIRTAALASIAAGLFLSASVFAVGETGQQSTLRGWLQQRAPLAYSADGRWRLHVDASQILHRTAVGHPGSAQSIRLPINAKTLASSRSGDRVVFTSESACVGLVTFKDKARPTIAWLHGGPASSMSVSATPMAPGMPHESRCGLLPVDTVDIAPDGRYLATPFHVIDIDTGKAVAHLPRNTGQLHGRAVVKVAFIDNQRGLLVFSRFLGEGYESLSLPSNLQVAVWDLASGRLRRLDTIETGDGALGIANYVEYSAPNGAFYRVDHAANFASQRRWKAGRVESPLELVRHQLDRCDAKPSVLLKLKPNEWENLLVDPAGRWVATVRKRKADMRGNFDGSDTDEELLVHDPASGKEIARFRVPRGMRGMLASPDGLQIRGLTAVPSKDPYQRVNYGGDPVSVDLPPANLRQTALAPPSVSASCPIEDEMPQARTVARSLRLLDPLWTLMIDESSRLVSGKDDALWLDEGAMITALDPLTGKTLGRFPSGRTDETRKVAAPHSGGFISFEGDTLSWEAFGQAAQRPRGRRMIERMPGWRVGQVHFQGRGLVAYWTALEQTKVAPQRGEAESPRALVVTYDAASLRSVARRRVAEDELGMLGDYTEPHYAPAHFPLCVDAAGAMDKGFDWRLGHFDSFRMVACGSAGAKRTVLWSHLDIAPKSASASVDPYETQRAVLGHDAGIAVAHDGGVLRVFDVAARHEMAQVSLTEKGPPYVATVRARAGVVLVEYGVQRDSGPARAVGAYLLAPRPGAQRNKK